MPTLTILRHAKSDWDDPVKPDFDRPLNPRGQRAAERMGVWLRDEGLTFDAVRASPAERVRRTIEGVEAGLGYPLNPVFHKRIYMATAATLLELLHETPDDVGHLLLIGHNPGLEDLLLLLASPEQPGPLRAEVEIKYPTAALATLEFPDAKSWVDVGEGGAVITRFIRPRDLDSTLGPG